MINTGVKFVKDAVRHDYFNSENVQYTSMTKLIEKYKRTYDKAFWSFYKAVQYSLGIPDERKKEFSKMFIQYGGDSQWDNLDTRPLVKICVAKGIDVEKILVSQDLILDNWKIINKASTDRGTAYHDKKEQEAYVNGKDTIGKEQAPTVTSYSFDLINLKDGFHPELMLYVHKYKVAGQMDKAIIKSDIFGNRWVTADDYKTNKKIDIKNVMGKKMKYPLDTYDDCNFIHYCIQINGYLFMLSEHGFKPEFPTRFTHVLLNDRNEEIGTKTYLVPDMQKDVKLMFEHHLSTLK